MAKHRLSDNGMDEKTREAFESAFKAMADWRDDITESNERHGMRIFDKLGMAARSAGWPDGLIEATRSQLMQASKMQTDMIDHMMETWERQLKEPSGPSIEAIRRLVPNEAASAGPLAMAPTHLWMQAMAMWQKNWADSMSIWMGGANQGQDNRKHGFGPR